MQMTWAELARATPENFSPAAWPRGVEGDPEPLARQMHRAAAALANSVNGPLVGAPVAVVSSHPEHAILARLLACHGATVFFFCPEPVVWHQGYEPILRALKTVLEEDNDHLDPAPLRDVTAANFTQAPNFTVAPSWPPAEDAFAGKFARVFACDLLGKTAAEVGPSLARFAALLQGGGFLELLGSERGPATRALLEHTLGLAFSAGFGAQAACSAPRGEWRLCMRWLGSPVREYPREEDHPQLLAHCEARLHFAAHFVRGADVLEAGCGSGVGTKLLLEAGAAHVVGLDYNVEALELARARAADRRVEYRQWDLNQSPLPLPDGRFDVVVCLEVLEHVREQRTLLAEFLRVLKPGGRLIVSIPDHAFEEAFAVLNGYRNTFHVRVPERAELEQYLTGFAQVRFARQIDFLGSCVVEDDAAALGGAWGSPQPGPARDTAETILAVGVKPPAELARPVGAYRPHLCVFDNALRGQVEEKGHVRRLEVALADERAARWADHNRYEAVVRRQVTGVPLADPRWQKDLVRAWFRGGVEAYACYDVLPGDWIPRIEAFLASGRAESTAFRQPAHFELVEENGGTVLRVGVPSPVGVRTVLYPRPGAEVGVRSLWHWYRQGARSAWFAEDGGWKQYDLSGYFAWRLVRWAARRLFPCARRRPMPRGPRPNNRWVRWAMALGRRSAPPVICHPPSAGSGPDAWLKWVSAADAAAAARPKPASPQKTVHYIGALYAGGAERQLCNLVLVQKQRGHSVRVVTTCELTGDCTHYAGLLAPANISVRRATRLPLDSRLLASVPWHLLRPVPVRLQHSVIALVHELLADPPDVLHCWLDQPNVIGAIAGLLAGVPHVVLSTRNSNPTNFPRLWAGYFEEWYGLVSRSSRIHLIANSRSGAASYAEWIGLPLERIHVVFNGVCFDHFPEPNEALRREARASFGLADGDPVVCGVFRLAAEKQPELFLDVVRRARQRVPRLQVLLAGTGDLEGRVRQVVRENGMEEWVRLLGRRSDVASVFLASDVSLLTSTLEGCPNVALESQYLGVPVVATAGGGTGDAVSHGVTGFLAGVKDAEGLAAALTRLLLDGRLRQQMAHAAPAFVRERFGLERMVDETVAVYTAEGPAAVVRPDSGGTAARAA